MPDYAKEARKAKREGDFSKAGDLFFLAGDDKSAMEMYLKGNHYDLAARLLEKREDWRGAAKYYTQAGKFYEAAEIYSNRIRDYRTASVMYHSHGDLARASDMAEKAGDVSRAAIFAEQAELWERSANLYVQAQKYDKAADIFYRLLQQLVEDKEERGFVESFMARLSKIGNAAGTLYLRSKNYLKAAQCFEHSENFSKAAEAYALANMPEKAAEFHYKMQEYEEAYNLLSPHVETVTNKELLGDICLSLKRYDEAGDNYLLANKNLKAAEAYEAGGNFLKSAMLYESMEDYLKAAELYWMLKEPRKAADLFAKGKNFEHAAKLYEDIGVIDLAIQNYMLSGQKLQSAKLLVANKQHQKAVAILQEIHAEEEDDYTEACVMLGQLFTELGMYAVAVQKFTEVIKTQPLNKESLDLYYEFAVTLEKSAQYSKAREVFEKILSVRMEYRDVMQRLQKIKSTNLLDGAVNPTDSSIKRVLVGRYELIEKVARDAFGVVYKATDTSLGRKVLVRRIPEQDPNFTRSIIDQARIMAGIHHPNILSILDTGKDDQNHFICMEYVEGKTLRHYLSEGKLDISDICEFASQICLGLGYAHKKGMLHKSLSPENVYIGQGNQLKIANFGIEGRWEKGSTLVGKQYTSPEQLMGQKMDQRTDLYSFGVILYEMVYGTAPFSGQDVELQHLKKIPSFPEAAGQPVPVFLIKIMQRCLQKDRNNRYANTEELLEELEIADIVPGMLLNHRYEIIKELGTGGMGRVYQARDRDLDELVALKVLRAEVSSDPSIQKRFVREIKVARMITHPNVVKVFDIGKYKGSRYISMEFIEGINLDDWLKNNPRADMRTLLTILAKIIQGVHAAHAQKIIHRDLKPQNVILDRSMNPRVLDFGIARSKDHVDGTTGGQVLGSPKYMSPEQIQGKDLDRRSDIYSLGVMMFYMFTGQEPFGGDDPRTIIMKHLTQPLPDIRKINPAVPQWLDTIIRKTLEKDRTHRYSSLKDVLDDLRKGYETQKV